LKHHPARIIVAIVCRSVPRSGAWRTILSTEPATAATVLAGPVPAPERRASASAAGAIPRGPARGHGAARVARATAWLAALLLLLAAGLAVFSIDLLHHRLIASGQEFDAQAHRFERFWTLHDAAQEASLAITLDLASAAPIPQADAARFDAAARALGAEMAPPGPSMLSQGPAWATCPAAWTVRRRSTRPGPCLPVWRMSAGKRAAVRRCRPSSSTRSRTCDTRC
jgi:hypothetical protein